MRLDKFLTQRLPHYITRNQIQKLLKSQRIRVDDQGVKASHLIAPGEVITIEYDTPYEPTLYPENIALDIMYEDEHLLVINKPPGLIVHPGAGNATGTLVNALIYHCSDLSNENGPLRPGIVHRLDKDTSGLMLTAKDNRIHASLVKQFEKRTIGKYYLALVWGHMDAPSGDIDLPIGRSARNRKKFAVVEGGRQSLTRYEVLEEFEFLSLLRLKLETGRTHQIRVHLSHLHHPVFGDPFYGGRNARIITLTMRNRRLAAKLLTGLDRQALHAWQLKFVHPLDSKPMEMEAPLHEDYRNLLRELNSQYTGLDLSS
jgi:23S rRNA pseudouridine1911/1915/1917 synthase